MEFVKLSAQTRGNNHQIQRSAASKASVKEEEIRTALAKARREVAFYERELVEAQGVSRQEWELEEQTFRAWQEQLLEERVSDARVRAIRWELERGEAASPGPT